MTNLPRPVAGEGRISTGLRTLTDQSNITFPSVSRGMLTSRTTRGTFARPGRITRQQSNQAPAAGARWL